MAALLLRSLLLPVCSTLHSLQPAQEERHAWQHYWRLYVYFLLLPMRVLPGAPQRESEWVAHCARGNHPRDPCAGLPLPQLRPGVRTGENCTSTPSTIGTEPRKMQRGKRWLSRNTRTAISKPARLWHTCPHGGVYECVDIALRDVGRARPHSQRVFSLLLPCSRTFFPSVFTSSLCSLRMHPDLPCITHTTDATSFTLEQDPVASARLD